MVPFIEAEAPDPTGSEVHKSICQLAEKPQSLAEGFAIHESNQKNTIYCF